MQTVGLGLLRHGGFFYIAFAGLLSIAGVWACKRFKSLRDAYTRKKRELLSKSGQEAKRVKKWRYFDMMTFLDPYCKYQRCVYICIPVYFIVFLIA